MRIGLSCNFIEPALCQGKLDGIGTFTQSLYQQLQASGKAVLPVVFPSFKNRYPVCQLPAAQVMKQPYPLGAGFSALLGTEIPGAGSLRGKIDLYHCTDYLIPRLKNIPVVAMIHDAVKVQHPTWNSGQLRRLKTLGLKKAIHWASHYIAPSQAVIPELVEFFGIDEKKITVVHNAISEEWLTPPEPEQVQAVLAKYHLQPQFLLFAGTFQPRKNLRRILAAVKSLPASIQKQHPLVLVGQRGWVEEEVINEIVALSKKGLVRWLDYISTLELRCLYQSAKLFLLPSLHEGFGLPILEAFASATPVITANRSAMPEVAGEAAYLIDPEDVGELRHAILTLLAEPGKCEELIMKGKERVQAFTWERCREEVLEVYRKVLP